jgi:hypothetical protein
MRERCDRFRSLSRSVWPIRFSADLIFAIYTVPFRVSLGLDFFATARYWRDGGAV